MALMVSVDPNAADGPVRESRKTFLILAWLVGRPCRTAASVSLSDSSGLGKRKERTSELCVRGLHAIDVRSMVVGMAEGILLPSVARGTLLPREERIARLEQAIPQIRAALEGERDAIVIQATLACLLWETLAQANWCGFYRRIDDRTLAVGPYQGSMGCLRIDFARGVCGACARTREVQLVPDVTLFPGHIACDDRTRSELVVPVVVRDELRAVLDLDSPHLDGFDRTEAVLLDALMAEAFSGATFG